MELIVHMIEVQAGDIFSLPCRKASALRQQR